MSDQVISALIGAIGICLAAIISAKSPEKRTGPAQSYSISVLFAIGVAGVSLLVASSWMRGPQGAPGGALILASGTSADQQSYGDTFDLTSDGLLITTASTISSYSKDSEQRAAVSLSVFIDLTRQDKLDRIAQDSSTVENNSRYTLRASTAAVRSLRKGRYQIAASTVGGSDDARLDFSYVVLSLSGQFDQHERDSTHAGK